MVPQYVFFAFIGVFFLSTDEISFGKVPVLLHGIDRDADADADVGT